MKMKFIALAIATCLTLQSAAFAQSTSTAVNTIAATTIEKANTLKGKEKKVENETEKKSSKDAYYNLSKKDLEKIKTFDFERVFREADAYFTAAQKWKTLKCLPKTAYVCSKHECPAVKLTNNSALIMDKKRETLAMCQNQVCQYYSAEFEQTGIFTNVKVKGINGTVIRILGDNRFKQVSMVGLDAYITNGECLTLE